jgi:putative phosphoribosyl transferase
VVGLPRGGVITAAAIAEELDLPLDVLVIRKLGVPGQEELAMGAIGPKGIRVINHEVVRSLGIDPARIDVVAARELKELQRREDLYRAGRPPVEVRNKHVIVVDDGLATGSTMEAAVEVLRRHDPARITLAVPVAPLETLERFRFQVDELAYLETPEPFRSVGDWYLDFGQVGDAEVIGLLDRAASRTGVAS